MTGKITVKNRSKTAMSSERSSKASTPRRTSTSLRKKDEPIILTGRPIETKSVNTVGFKSGGIKTEQDLTHFRRIFESQTNEVQAKSVFMEFQEKISHVPIESYAELGPAEQYEMIKKLIDIYNFSWNECCFQLHKISNEHSKLLTKLKSFYNLLLDLYPELILSYHKQFESLTQQNKDKDREIQQLKQELNFQIDRNNGTKKYIIDCQNEIMRLKSAKKYYKNELNNEVSVVEQAKSYITEMRLQIQMLKEENERLKNSKISIDMPTASNAIPHKDIGVSTTDFLITPQNSVNTLPDVPLKQRPHSKIAKINSVDRLLSNLNINTVEQKYIPLRHTVFSFIVNSNSDVQSELVKQQDNTEFKTFNWLFPKICTIFVTVMNNEDPSSPFHSFDQVIMSYISKIYHTSFLTQKMTSCLVQSAHIIDSKNYIFKMFNKFLENNYDFTCYRFFSTMLEFSISYAKPDISTIVANETISEEDAVITILPDDAIKVHKAVFPFWQTCPQFTSTQYPIDYWEFLDILIEDFMDARQHMTAFVKNGLLLAGCQDLSHITLKNFVTFNAISFPDADQTKVKEEWRHLITRYEALGNINSDTVDLPSIVYYCVSKDSLILLMMKTSTPETFSQTYYDMNLPMLEALQFVIKRLTVFIPSLINCLPDQAAALREHAHQMRESLFLADIAGALGFYRQLLHVLDEAAVQDFSTLAISNACPEEQIKKILDHIETRERVVGVVVM